MFFHVSEVLPEEKTPQTATPAEQPKDEALADGQDTGPSRQQPSLSEDGAAPSHVEQQVLPQEPFGSAQAEDGAKPHQDAERRRQKETDLSELLQPGDPVEFVVAASNQDGVRHKGNKAPKMMAKLVCPGWPLVQRRLAGLQQVSSSRCLHTFVAALTSLCCQVLATVLPLHAQGQVWHRQHFVVPQHITVLHSAFCIHLCE